MRDPKRITKFIDITRQIWKMNPDLRFGQLILNTINNEDLYYIEDDELLKRIVSTYSKEDEINSKLNNLLNNKEEN